MKNYGLSDEQLYDCKETFKFFDKDNSNSIDATELGNLLRVSGLKPSKKEIEEKLNKYDLDKSGKIEFEEFIEIYKDMKEKPLELESVIKAFNFFDKDGSGSISMDEFKYAVTSKGQKLSNEDVEKFFKNIDSNNDGEITLDEFKRVFG